MSHPRIAVLTIAAAVVLDQLLGLGFALAQPMPLWHAEFCALANAVTDGGDVTPRNGTAYAVTAAEYVLVVPLFAATFSLFTSGLSSIHIRRAEQSIKTHVEERLHHHLYLGSRPGKG